MNLHTLVDKKDAEKIIDFFCLPNLFYYEFTDIEKKLVRTLVMKAFDVEEDVQYWYYKNEKEEIIGAGSLGKLSDTDGGYFLGWFAIHNDYRKKGLGRKILEKVEETAREKKGRFITIETSEFNSARSFYEKAGYKQVAFIPHYYPDKIAKILYQKEL